MYQKKTTAEVKELCKFMNAFHRIFWASISGCLAVAALIWNPYHLITAALLFGFSRIDIWEPWDPNAV